MKQVFLEQNPQKRRFRVSSQPFGVGFKWVIWITLILSCCIQLTDYMCWFSSGLVNWCGSKVVFSFDGVPQRIFDFVNNCLLSVCMIVCCLYLVWLLVNLESWLIVCESWLKNIQSSWHKPSVWGKVSLIFKFVKLIKECHSWLCFELIDIIQICRCSIYSKLCFKFFNYLFTVL